MVAKYKREYGSGINPLTHLGQNYLEVDRSLIPELFGTRLRYTGASVGYQLAAPVAGGLAPVIAVWLVDRFPGQFWPLAQYIILISVVSLACVQLLAETSRKDLGARE